MKKEHDSYHSWGFFRYPLPPYPLFNVILNILITALLAVALGLIIYARV